MPTMESLTKDLRAQFDATPLYAAVGVTDLWVEKAREARVKVQADLKPAAIRARMEEMSDRVRMLPKRTVDGGHEVATKVAEEYDDLAERGENLVKRIRNQQSTKDFVHQYESTVVRGKGAVTTARKTVIDVERSAKATLTTGRKEAMKAYDAVVEDIKEVSGEAVSEVRDAAKRTRTAARRTSTTAKKGAARTRSAAKGTTTSARTSAIKGTKATKKAAVKVGD